MVVPTSSHKHPRQRGVIRCFSLCLFYGPSSCLFGVAAAAAALAPRSHEHSWQGRDGSGVRRFRPSLLLFLFFFFSRHSEPCCLLVFHLNCEFHGEPNEEMLPPARDVPLECRTKSTTAAATAVFCVLDVFLIVLALNRRAITV